MPTGPAVLDHDDRAVGPLGKQAEASPTVSRARKGDGGVVEDVAALDEADRRRPRRRAGMSCGITAMAPRRATVSAIRRPATDVMLATTTGMVVPRPVDGGGVDFEPRRDARSMRDQEDVVVGELVRGGCQQAHVSQWCPTWTQAGGSRHRRPVGDTPTHLRHARSPARLSVPGAKPEPCVEALSRRSARLPQRRRKGGRRHDERWSRGGFAG